MLQLLNTSGDTITKIIDLRGSEPGTINLSLVRTPVRSYFSPFL